MGIFNNRLTAWTNRGNKKKRISKKYLYTCSVTLNDGDREFLDIGIKVPGNTKKDAIEYFDANIKLKLQKIVKDKSKRVKNHTTKGKAPD